MKTWLSRMLADPKPAQALPNYDPLEHFPNDIRVLAIGDIHGRADLLETLLKRFDAYEIDAEPLRTIIVPLGDIVDRGHDTRRVLDILVERARRQEVKAILGNHEAMMLRVLSEPSALIDWVRFGGLETLRSYGVVPAVPLDPRNMADTIKDALERIPVAHIAFLRSMHLAWTCGDITFVHAGVRPGVSLAEQNERDLLEIRQPFLSYEGWLGSYIVHGHTPVSDLEIHRNRMNLDTGAYATGKLTATIITRGKMFRLTAVSTAPTHQLASEQV